MEQKKKKKTKKPSNVMGRPKVFNKKKLEELQKLMRFKPRLIDAAAWFDCGKTTVEDTIREHFDMTFREFREKYMVKTRMALQQKAINMAMGGDRIMLLFTLKNLCGWQDNPDSFDDEDELVYEAPLSMTDD